MTWSYWDGGSSWDGGSWQSEEWREDQQWWKGETWRQRTPDSSYQSSSQCQWQGAKPDSQWQGTKPDSQWHDSNNLWQGQGNKAAQYASVTTLGLKNPLPLDERRELLLELIALGTDRGEPPFPRMAVFNWGAVTIQASFMILSRVEPGTPFRVLRDETGNYSKEHAAQVLLESFKTLHQTPEDRAAVVANLRAKCYDKTEDIVAEAQTFGFDPQQIEAKTLYCVVPRQDSRNGIITASRYAAAPPLGAPPKDLKRNNTDEEIEHLEKRRRLLLLQRNVHMQEREIGTGQAPHIDVPPKFPLPDNIRVPPIQVPDPDVLSSLTLSLPPSSFLPIGRTAEVILKQYESVPAYTDMQARLANGSKVSEQAAREELRDPVAKAKIHTEAYPETSVLSEAQAEAEAQSRVAEAQSRLAKIQARAKALAEAQAQAHAEVQAQMEALAQTEAQALAKAQAQTEEAQAAKVQRDVSQAQAACCTSATEGVQHFLPTSGEVQQEQQLALHSSSVHQLTPKAQLAQAEAHFAQAEARHEIALLERTQGQLQAQSQESALLQAQALWAKHQAEAKEETAEAQARMEEVQEEAQAANKDADGEVGANEAVAEAKESPASQTCE